MRALVLQEPGSSAAELAPISVPAPTADEGEVVLRLAAAAVNRSDLLNVIGLPITSYPRIPGRDFAGTVVEGPADLLGTSVWGTGGGDLGFRRDGSHAEFMTAPVEGLVPLPSRFSVEQAAAAGLSYLVAADGLATAGLEGPGQAVLVTGAAGGVGAAVSAIVRWRGASLIAVVLDDGERAAVLRRHPEATVVTAAARPLADAVQDATGGHGADIVYDTVGSPIFGDAAKALADGGRVVVITAAPGVEVRFDLFSFYRTGGAILTANSTRFDCVWAASVLRELMPGFESGALPPPDVRLCVPLDDCAEAFIAVQRGGLGRVVMTFDE